MSQFNAPPPPPPGQMPPNYGQPPGGPVGYGQMPPPQRTSVAAIISLISGILGCFVITGIIAIITGIIGLSATSNPNVKGRGLAITGIILGLILGLVGGSIGGVSFWAYRTAMNAANSGKTFVADLQAGKLESAQNYTTLTSEEIASFKQQIDGWGELTDWSVKGFNSQKNLNGTNVEVTGTATFATAGAKEFELILGESNGELKIKGIHFR